MSKATVYSLKLTYTILTTTQDDESDQIMEAANTEALEAVVANVIREKLGNGYGIEAHSVSCALLEKGQD